MSFMALTFLYSLGSNPGYCVMFNSNVFNLEQFLGLFLTFMTLTFLKNTSKLFYRLFLSLTLSDVSS